MYSECQDLKEFKLATKYLNIFTGIFITLANYGFRFIIIHNVKVLKFKSLSDKTSRIKFVISKFSFVVKCMLMILIGSWFVFAPSWFCGLYTDFNKHWFLTNGNIIVLTIASCIFLPIMNCIYIYLKHWFYRALD